jgi:hypothetical protein
MNLVLGWNLGVFLPLLDLKKKVKEVDLVFGGFRIDSFEILYFK